MTAVVTLTVFLEHTRPGARLEHAGYDFVQSRLSSEKVPLAVVDISKLKPIRSITPRDKLKAIINAVADQGAKVIAVDVNFAPLANGDYVSPVEDPEFFQFCLDKKKKTPERNGVPILLAVDWAGPADSEPRRPELLINNPNYKDLVACVRIPTDTSKLPYKISDKTGFEVSTMGAALADAYRRTEEDSPRWIPRLPPWIARQFSIEELKYGVRVEQFPVDYSALDALQSHDHTLATAEPFVIKDQGGFLRDKIVLIGDGTLGNGVDTFTVPGRTGQFPGVYLHSCAAYSLIEAPLYMLSWQGGVLIDSLLAFVILVAVTGIRWYYKSRTPKEVAKHRLEKLFTLLVGLVAIVFGVWFVNYHRVMWEDFVVVVPLLFLHPSIERYLGNGWSYLKRKTPAAIEAVIFEHGEEKHK